MPSNLLFGYSIEEDDGKLIVTVSGSHAQSLIGAVVSDPRTRDAGLGALLSPLRVLGSQGVALFAQPPASPARPNEKPDLKAIFGQGFDKTRSEFDAQLSRYRELLNAPPSPEAEIEPPDADGPSK